MISKVRRAVRRMKAWHTFRRTMALLRDGLPQSEVLALLGAPDVVYDGDAEAGIDFSWGYHERLPDHHDLIVAFADGAICYSSI